MHPYSFFSHGVVYILVSVLVVAGVFFNSVSIISAISDILALLALISAYVMKLISYRVPQ